MDRRLILALVALAGVLVAGCGSGPDKTEEESAPTGAGQASVESAAIPEAPQGL